jgi:zinc protease
MITSSQQARWLREHNVTFVQKQAGISEYRLGNGLKILLQENHNAPVTVFQVVYRVGSRNEAVGHTGATHFLEHMMFKGTDKFSPRYGNGVMETLARIGAISNATTWFDRTNYFECTGSEHLELCIRIEADRMRNLKLRQSDRDSEMTVVRNEFERGENDPNNVLYHELFAVAFREHPYHHPTIGWKSDVEGVPLAKQREFYDTYYWPNNATSILLGDFDTFAALKLYVKYFGKISGSPEPIPTVYTVEPAQEGERRFEIRRNGDLPRLTIGYHIPEATHGDHYALDVLQALLGDSDKASSRLYKILVDTNLVSGCSAAQYAARDPSLFMVYATANMGIDLSQIETAIYEELENLATTPVSDEELRICKAANLKHTVLGNADPLRLSSSLVEAEACADWIWLVEYDDKFSAVTPEDIMRVARKYFQRRNRTVGHFIPEASSSHESDDAVSETKTSANEKAKAKISKRKPAKVRRVKLAKARCLKHTFASQVVRHVLPNGLTILAMANRGSQTVSMRVNFNRNLDPSIHESLAGQHIALLNAGSEQYSKQTLANIFEEMGTNYSYHFHRFDTGFRFHVTSDDFRRLVSITADMICHPLFLPREYDLTREQTKSDVTRWLNTTERQAYNVFFQQAYPLGHLFHERPYSEALPALDLLTEIDIRNYHGNSIGPQTTIITVVGDIDPDEAIRLITDGFGNWTNNVSRREINFPSELLLPQQAQRHNVFLADKKNASIVIGRPLKLSVTSPDFPAAHIANNALGADALSSRLGKIVRIKHGLTYGIHSQFYAASFGETAWQITLSVNPAKVDEALLRVHEVLADYQQNGMGQEELEDEIGRYIGEQNVSLRTSTGISAYLNAYEFTGRTMAEFDNMPQIYQALTRQEVNAAIAKYFNPDNLITVVAGTLSSK